MSESGPLRPPVLVLTEREVDLGVWTVGDIAARRTTAIRNDGDGDLNAIVTSAPAGIKAVLYGLELSLEVDTASTRRVNGAVRISSDGGVGEVRVVGLVQPTAESQRRRRAALAAVGGLLLLVVGVAVGALAGRSQDEPETAVTESTEITPVISSDDAATSVTTAAPVDTPAPTVTIASTLAPTTPPPVATTSTVPVATVETPATPAPTRAPGAVPIVANVSASVVRSNSQDACGNPTSYQPAFAYDGLKETAWMAPGDGSGQSLTLTLLGPSVVQEVGLNPGYDKFDPCSGRERFYDLRQVTAVLWSFDDGSQVVQEVEPEPGLTTIRFRPAVVTSTVTLTVLSTTSPGDPLLDHTPISEVMVG